MKITIKEKIYVTMIFTIGLYLGFNLGMDRSMLIICGLIVGFIMGRLPTEEKPKTK